jgi:pimeloyl-ACP methyl ester carboxylesterase
VLVYNPGGPGLPGTHFVVDNNASRGTFSATLLARFDIVSWDPRGVSEGTTVDCVDDPERLHAMDPTLDTSDAMDRTEASVRGYATGCSERSSELVPHLSSVATAQDMDRLREALGEDQISYLGQSYGGHIGSIYATLFPQRVRAMVLDSALDIGAPWTVAWVQMAGWQEQQFNTMMDDCAANSFCPFHNDGDPFSAFEELLARLDEGPLLVNGTEVGLGHAVLAVWQGLWDEEFLRPELIRALADAQDGDGARILALTEPLGDLREPFWSTVCLDWPTTAWEPTQADIDAVLAASPRLGPYQTATASRIGPYFEGLNPCRFWTAPPELPPTITGSGAGPILLVGTTGDYLWESTQTLADRLEQGALLVVERNRHIAYQPGFMNTRCVTNTVDTYLTDLTVPPNNSVCQHGNTQLQPPP